LIEIPGRYFTEQKSLPAITVSMKVSGTPSQWLSHWAAHRAGATAPIFALCIGGLLSIVATALALAIDTGAAGDAQHTADQAAVAGATAFVTTGTAKAQVRSALAEEQAKIFATSNSEYTLVDLTVDTVTEDAYGQQTKIHVELEFQPVNIAARWTGRSGVTAIRRKATAEATWGFPLCALSLADSGNGVSTSDNVSLKAKNCIIWSNSTASASMDFQGGKAEAKEFCAAGGVSGASRVKPSPQEKCDVIPDPLADWATPLPGNCEVKSRDDLDYTEIIAWYIEHGDHLGIDSGAPKRGEGHALTGSLQTEHQILGMDISVGSEVRHVNPDGTIDSGPAKGLTLNELLQIVGVTDNVDPETYKSDRYYNQPTANISPGTYCGLDISQGHIEFSPGTYFIKDAPLVVRRRGTLTGKGVTIVLSGENATFSVLDEGRLTLSGPEAGDTAGFALVEDKSPSFSDTPRSRLTGSGVIDAIGTIYLPRHDFAITGKGAGKQASPLLQIVAHRLMMSDEGELKIKFDTSKTKVPVGIKPERTARLID